ncbi:transposase [Fusarium langsethiae]|uniref:Transposase n=1 Tax=Fusarium langsethiae TaxID=179993 RepID=A0A0M9ENN5_FUSLA|nr:transposase [Fusarium langsethiae]
MSSSRTTSHMSSTPQSLPSRPPPIPADDGFEGTPASREATTDETDASPCEFEIDWENIWHGGKRLMGAKRRPRHRRVIGTKIKESWIYRHGANLEHHGHQITEAGESDPSLATPFTLAATSGSSLSRLLSRQASLGLQLASHFDEGTWKARFVDWIIVEDVTFRQASSERLRWLIANGGELASQLLPEHHTTVCSWIRQTFESRRQIIANLVKNATSSVHLSFDLWTASNGCNYVGIVGHFVDSNGEKLWETLKTMDYLFVKFKQAAEETQFEEPSHFKSGIDCGWAKLEDYYVKSDRTPVYRAALALHPSYGYDYFERHWKTAMDRPQWYNDMQSAVGSLFGEYARQAEVEAQAQAGLLEVHLGKDQSAP